MEYFYILILYCINKLNAERSVRAVQYVLTGKKSAQTLQDTVWYSLKNLYHTFPEMPKEHFDRTVKKLEASGYITVYNQSVQITNSGKNFLNENIAKYPLPAHLNGWKFYHVEKIYWQRLTLIVQVLSNWIHNEKKFFPVCRDRFIQSWVKRWLGEQKQVYDKNQLSSYLYNELYAVFEICERNFENPNFIVLRLTGYRKPGLTLLQVANLADIDEIQSAFAFRSCFHFMIQTIWDNENEFPLLYSIFHNDQSKITLSSSSWETYKFLKNGKSIEEIAQLRKLKKNTIEDHIVEISLIDSTFSIDHFVVPEVQKQIVEVVQQLHTKRLKTIKEHLHNVDYFAIRLVLSKMNEIKF